MESADSRGMYVICTFQLGLVAHCFACTLEKNSAAETRKASENCQYSHVVHVTGALIAVRPDQDTRHVLGTPEK